MTTKVVNINSEKCDIYIGRWYPGRELVQGPFANPFIVGVHGSRDEVIAKYREWLLSQPELCARARSELRGKVLGCWCVPLACHGHVLAEIADAEES